MPTRLSIEQITDLATELYATDLIFDASLRERMTAWTLDELTAYLESNGEEMPTSEHLIRTEPSTCCPAGSLPPLNALAAEEAPHGEKRSVAGLTIYVTGDEAAARCVVVASDIWGWQTGRHRQVCDVLGSFLHCAVYMVDFFHGDPCTPEKGPGRVGFAAWARRWHPDAVRDDLDALLGTLPPSCRRVGLVGFCWGSFACVVGSATGRFDAVACAHPSHRKLLEGVHGMSADEADDLVGAGRAPTLMLAAAGDDARCLPGERDEALLSAAHVPRSFEAYAAPHGFVVRGAMNAHGEAVQRAVARIVAWMEEHLAGLHR